MAQATAPILDSTFSDMVRCLTYVRSALKSGRTANAVVMTKSSVRHRSIQPIIIEGKAPKLLKSLSGNLGKFRSQRGPHFKGGRRTSDV